jgi:NAD(P)H dehydrogenase (quinone)
MSIVVTATSGYLGRLVVQDLLDRGVPAADVVAGARSLDAITDLAQTGVRTGTIDYNEPATVEAAALGPGHPQTNTARRARQQLPSTAAEPSA